MRDRNYNSVVSYVSACALLGKLVLFFLVLKEAALQFWAEILVPSPPAHMYGISSFFRFCGHVCRGREWLTVRVRFRGCYHGYGTSCRKSQGSRGAIVVMAIEPAGL